MVQEETKINVQLTKIGIIKQYVDFGLSSVVGWEKNHIHCILYSRVPSIFFYNLSLPNHA
jgi:hypothetical protein